MLILRPTTAMTRRSLFKSAGLVALGAAVASPLGKALLAALPEDPGAEAKRVASEAVVIGVDYARGVATSVMLKYDKAKDTWELLDVAHEVVKKAITHEDLRNDTVDAAPGYKHQWERVAEKTGATLKAVRRVAAEVLEGSQALRAKGTYCEMHGHQSPQDGFGGQAPGETFVCVQCGKECSDAVAV